MTINGQRRYFSRELVYREFGQPESVLRLEESSLSDAVDGDVEIEGPVNDSDRSIAKVVASTIPGVVQVTVR